VALNTALRRFKQLDSERKYYPQLYDEVQQLETIFHGHPSGMDAATVLSGGAMWYRKGPPHEILALRIPTVITGLICIVEPGARTVEIVEQVRQQRELNQKRVDAILDEIGEVTTEAGIVLGSGRIKETGELMVRNHELLTRLGVSTPALDRAVELLCSKGSYGAKLTGAGGGGAVIALVDQARQFRFAEELSSEFALVFPFTLGVSA
jgi:mevalonate kinase